MQKAALTLQERMQDDDFLRGTFGVTIQAKSRSIRVYRQFVRVRHKQGSVREEWQVKTIEDIFQVAQIRIILHDTGNLAG